MSDDHLLIRPLSDQFPATSRWIYIDAASSGLLPETARERVAAVLEAQLLASFGENHALSMLQSCRELFARLVGGGAADIRLFPSSAEALRAVSAGLAAGRRSNIVLCQALSRPSFTAFWLRYAQRSGLEVREAVFDQDSFPAAQLKTLMDAGTAMVTLPVISRARGWRLPVDADDNALGIQGAAFVFVAGARGGQLQFDFHLYNRLRDVMDVRRIAVQSLSA